MSRTTPHLQYRIFRHNLWTTLVQGTQPIYQLENRRNQMPKHTTETIKEYYAKNQRRKKEITPLNTTIIETPEIEIPPRGYQDKPEEKKPSLLSNLQQGIQQQESDENPNWRKKFVRKEEEPKTNWKQRFKEMEEEVQELTRTCENKKTRRPKPTIEDEIDEETHKNHTQNPLPYDEVTLLQAIETETDDEDELLIAYVQNKNTADLWVNKTNIATELAKKDAEKKETKTLEEMVPPELMKYKAVFDEVEASIFPESRPWDHAIDLKDDFVPKDCPIYPLSLPEQGKLQDFIDDNLQKGYIRPSKSPMASPFFFVDKKDGKLRPCQDYRTLNEGTIKNTYPLPLISELIDQLKGSKYFTKLDIRWGYNNVRIKDGDQWKAAFKTNLGLFEPTVMFFGLTNSPATFQTMMNELFRDLIRERWVITYMDDILICTKTIEENIRCTKRVLQRLEEHDLYLKPEKCLFWRTEVEYLGMVISENQLKLDPVKVAGIADWPTPKTIKDVRSFLGFGNYYRRFIHAYGDF